MAWIHPFGDGNGRTARLLEFRLLLSGGVPDVAAHLLSNHYNNTRTEYYRQLDLSSLERDPLPFVRYALQGFADSLREQVEMIKAQQLAVHWANHVYATIPGHTPASARQRHLVLDLPANAPTPMAAVPSLTPRLAREYARKTEKNLRRDLHRLRELELVRITPEGALPNIELLRAFLPLLQG